MAGYVDLLVVSVGDLEWGVPGSIPSLSAVVMVECSWARHCDITEIMWLNPIRIKNKKYICFLSGNSVYVVTPSL